MSLIAYIFVADSDVARVASRLESFAGKMVPHRGGRDAGASFRSVDAPVFVNTNHPKPDGFESYGAVVAIRSTVDEDTLRSSALKAFDVLRSFGDTALAATIEIDETLATYAPRKHSAA